MKGAEPQELQAQPERAAVTDDADLKPKARARSNRFAVAIVAVVVLLFAGVLVVKSITGSQVASTSSTMATPGASSAPASLTSTHNDAVADYEAALKSGKPVYILFHSLS